MSYINRFKLIQEALNGNKLDSKELLDAVDKQAVINSVKKSKDGLPEPFRYTDAPIEEENFAKLPRKEKRELLKIFKKTPKFPEKELSKLIKLKEKFSNVPAIYNYICSAYAHSNQNKKYFKAVTETYHKFPNYLFGKTALAEYYINKDEHKRIPKILDGKFEIYMHYPPTKEIFHISEVRAFYSVTGIYYARANRIAKALFCYFTLEETAPDHNATVRLGNEIVYSEVKNMKRKMKRSPN